MGITSNSMEAISQQERTAASGEQKPTSREAKRKEQQERITNLQQAIEAEKNRADNTLRQLRYVMADLDNYRKLCERRVEDAIKYGNERLMKDLIVVLDELRLATRVGPEVDKEALRSGVEIVLRKFEQALEKSGLKPIEALGKPFDPVLHEAVTKELSPDHPDGIVLEEINRGYLLSGKVLKPSVVKVSVNPEKHDQVKE